MADGHPLRRHTTAGAHRLTEDVVSAEGGDAGCVERPRCGGCGRYNRYLPDMKTWRTLSFGVAASALVASTLFAAGPRIQSPAQQSAADASEAAEAALVSRMCGGQCHVPAEVLTKRRTKIDWQDVLDRMVEKGATGASKDFERVLAYLCRTYGEIYINRAPPDEIAMTLGLSKKDADAVVAYRKANGSFADIDAVKKVPDLDIKTLDKRKDSIIF